MINATQNDAAGQHSDERMSTVSPRPAWAAECRIDPESVMHIWTAPTVAQGADSSCGDTYPIPVEIMQVDDLYVMPDGVVLDRGEPVLFLLDANIRDTANGRLLAQAILEACDRLDQAESAR